MYWSSWIPEGKAKIGIVRAVHINVRISGFIVFLLILFMKFSKKMNTYFIRLLGERKPIFLKKKGEDCFFLGNCKNMVPG